MSARVLVIGGGENSEHDVSLAGAASVARALSVRGHAVTELTIGRDGVWRHAGRPLGSSAAASLSAGMLLIDRVDVVFPILHGPRGEDGSLAALCALAHTRMVGSALGAGALGMDKTATKLVAEAAGIRTARSVTVRGDSVADLEFTETVVVKPVAAGSSYGVALATTAAEFASALTEAARYDDRILIEQVVRGREIDVAVLREADGTRRASPALEIHSAGLFDTTMKYDGSAPFSVPAQLDARERATLERAALTMFDALGCAGVARVDFFLTPDGLVLNEVNTIPGMTENSQVPRMFAADGLSYGDLVDRLVDAARVPGERLEAERMPVR